MLLATLAFVTTFATNANVGVEEVNIAMNPETSSMLQIPLLMDAFNKLDLNGDTFLDKQERKPLKMTMYTATAMLYREGDHVTREKFIEEVSVPDLANHDVTEVQCMEEDAIISVQPEALWDALAGDQAWMTVSDFADALYNLAEVDLLLDYSGFQQYALRHTYPQDFHAQEKFSYTKLSDYVESHNPACAAGAVERRRRLFLEEAAAAVGAAAQWVGRAVAIAGIGAVAECGVQAFMHKVSPNGWLHNLYDEGCTWNALKTDFMFNLGAQAFTGVGLWAYGGVASYMGWGVAADAAATGATGGAVEATEMGRPILAHATEVAHFGGQAGSGIEHGVDAINQAGSGLHTTMVDAATEMCFWC